MENTFTAQEIDSIICEIFGCNERPVEEVSLSKIYAEIDEFGDDIFGANSSTSSIRSSLSDYGLCNLFNEVPRSEWSHGSNCDQRSQASSIGSDYGLYNLFNRVPRSDWSHRRCSTGSLISNPDAHPLFAFINPITWPDVRKRSKTPKLSLYA